MIIVIARSVSDAAISILNLCNINNFRSNLNKTDSNYWIET
jgi:hypothetical protein